MQKKQIIEYLDTVIIGSGLSALNFIDTFSKKKKKIDVISPNFNFNLSKINKKEIKFLPSQMRHKKTQVENYFVGNNLKKTKNCKIIGSLDFGGLSNYWGLQIDNYINLNNQKLKKKTKKDINSSFLELLRNYKLLGTFKSKDTTYSNDYLIPSHLEEFKKQKNKKFNLQKPILAFNKLLKKKNLNNLNENKDKLNSYNFLKMSRLSKKIRFHNFYLDEMTSLGKKIKLTCKNKNRYKVFIANKVILATGTIATTKLVMGFLNIKREVKINHHPRLIAVYLGKKNIKFNLNFTPSLLQFIGKGKDNYFCADFRPGNKLITESMVELSKLLYPLKSLINFFKNRLIFTNILLSPKYSDIYIKNLNKSFLIYTKKNNLLSKLKKANFKIFSFLNKKKIIYPFFKTHFPGVGSDFHYFGTLPMNSKSKLSVNEKCQLKDHNNIFIVDSSVFNFKENKYPLGIVMANARRVGKLIS